MHAYAQHGAPSLFPTQVLSQLAGEEGFFLMVEGSKIDKAAHPNDPGANFMRIQSEWIRHTWLHARAHHGALPPPPHRCPPA